ncbi:O-acetyltransferase WecH [Fundidesulfovibrio magnetotacticus]|uniref:O-acetyltransferase WecH n=1 Tax=Fundidesulfovibrio magnetotacticus TaxID=2730080 RepID=A0A6V8M247_9BACT|nr:acyltransferase [Fundidesulfovibrio magnetotacticus]GFK95897.1 O-acetyltransferase WecH [Fundidesulfovibrio magnetotacticus]
MSANAPSHAPKRQPALDLLRCLAIAGVVVMHCASPLTASPDPSAVWAGVLYSSLSLFCVPVMLMISGALLLGNPKPIDLKAFYGRRCMKILVPLLGWSLVYYLLVCLQTGTTPHVISFFKRFFTGMWSGPLWFLYMILGVYLMTPFMAQAFGRGREALAWTFTAIVFAVPALNFATRLIWEMELNRFLTGAVIPYYFGYFVLGNLLNEHPPRVPGGRWTLAAAFAAGALPSAFGEFAAKGVNTMLPNTFFSYQQPLAVLMSGAIFLFFKDWSPRLEGRAANVVREVSSLTYGIFLAHVLALSLVTGQLAGPLAGLWPRALTLDWNTGGPWIGPVLTGAAVFTLSALLVWGLRRVPVLGRIVP